MLSVRPDLLGFWFVCLFVCLFCDGYSGDSEKNPIVQPQRESESLSFRLLISSDEYHSAKLGKTRVF